MMLHPPHTPLPWRHEVFAGRAIRVLANQGPLEVSPATVHGIADARFIVRACNAHADLVEALTKICSEFAQQHPLIMRGREALAKATT